MSDELSTRIHHEDTLLANRVAAFLTANAFVTVAFVTVLVGIIPLGQATEVVESAILGLAFFLSFFFTAIGRRSIYAIRFWRACQRSGLENVPDSKLREFFFTGRVTLDNGSRLEHSAQHEAAVKGSVDGSIPWRWKWTRSPNDVAAVILPTGVGVFWMAISWSVQWGAAVQLGPIEVHFVGPVVTILGLLIFYGMMRTWPSQGVSASPADRTLLAILGRGIQFRSPAPNEWVPSPDFEICSFPDGDKPIHTTAYIDARGDEPNCRIGGGQLNVDAAAALLKRVDLSCVLGYAHPAEYLAKLNGPSESLPMERALRAQVPLAKVIPLEAGRTGASHTGTEVENVFELARREGFDRIRFVTISPHTMRVAFYAQKFASNLTEYRKTIAHSVESSETLLLAYAPEHTNRVTKIQSSRAYLATLRDERIGLEKLQG